MSRCICILYVAALFAAALTIDIPSRGIAQARNCPTSADQIVTVAAGHPTTFRLNVTDLGNGRITIFQYPLGGVLQQTGATPLDFVFTPQFGFNGSTEFTYRIQPPFDCPGSVQLGRVTLVGGFADSTAVGLVPTVAPTVCGIGLFAPALLSMICMGLIRKGTPRRSNRRANNL